ncbi:MAG: radical SAM family heme chaperone HemW [SAR324 cluster bacterium]|nr:radical SAM family heme chaperone HemW [SAR324 cluster bacterium]
MIRAIYIHIPFCRRICPFCAFAVRKDRAGLHQQYLKLLLKELRRRAEQFSQEFAPLESIYIGGGTPSSLTLEEVGFLINGVKSQLDCSKSVEISFEINPEDATRDYLQGLANIGINRLSMGIQSFQESSLETLQRSHSVEHDIKAIDSLKSSAIANFNLDLMFGIPGQNFAAFQNDLLEFLKHDPSHLSLYALDIEPNTPFAHQAKMVSWVEEQKELTQQMYLWAIECLHADGIEQYEVSNFSKPGLASRSNLAVWSGAPYLGFGIGAHSYCRGQRWGNFRSLRTYHSALEKQEWPQAFQEKLTTTQQANEKLMLGLRQNSGFSVTSWPEEFDINWPQKNMDLLEQFSQKHYVNWNPPVLSLPPLGMLLADEITAQLMLDECS